MIDCPTYYIAEIYSMENLLPRRGPNTYDAGLIDREKSEVKYAYPSSTQPTLIITNPLYDNKFYPLMPGYYELNLSDDNAFILLCQRGEAIAKVPVIKIEIDREKMEKYVKENKKPNSGTEFILTSIKKKRYNRRRQKLLNNKFIEENPEIYNDATIEYDEKGDYYIIKYEKDMLRAWGVLKTN